MLKGTIVLVFLTCILSYLSLAWTIIDWRPIATDITKCLLPHLEKSSSRHLSRWKQLLFKNRKQSSNNVQSRSTKSKSIFHKFVALYSLERLKPMLSDGPKPDDSTVLTISKIFKNIGRLFKRKLEQTLTVPGFLEHTWLASAGIRADLGLKIHATYRQIPYGDLLFTAFGTALFLTIARKGLHRYRTAQEIPLRFFKQQRRLHGYAILVNDSDNIRFYHRPWVRLWCPNILRNDLKYETINVRLAGIDAPEMAHFGGQSQPYAEEAKQWLTKMVEGRPVTIWLHRYDQYSRIVASVYVGRLFKKNLSLAMVQAGYATLYDSIGAEYGGIKEKLIEAEGIARKKRKGMWRQDAKAYISPAEHKRKLKAAAASDSKPY